MEGFIAALLRDAPRARSLHPGQVPHVLTAVDGSVLRTLARLTAAAYLKDKSGRTYCPLLRPGPLVCRVPLVERHGHRRQQLRLPHPRQQRPQRHPAGTAAVGGFSSLAEGRREYGPPGLSNVPYASRLLRNNAYRRQRRSYRVLLGVRIISLHEEDERLLGQGDAR